MSFKQQHAELKRLMNELAKFKTSDAEYSVGMSSAEVLKKLKGRKKIDGLVYIKSQNCFKRKNLLLKMDTLESLSYNEGYRISFVKDGRLILNSYKYSATTQRHFWSVREVFQTLGIKIDYELELTRGRNDFTHSGQIRYLSASYSALLDKADLARTVTTKASYINRAAYYKNMLKILLKFEPNDEHIKDALAYVSTAKLDRAAKRAERKAQLEVERQLKLAEASEVVFMEGYRKSMIARNIPLITNVSNSISYNQSFGA